MSTNIFLNSLFILMGILSCWSCGNNKEEHVAQEISTVLRIPPTEGNPRNSEGDFIELEDGSILFIYSHFTGGSSDYAHAELRGRVSIDRGRNWTAVDKVILSNEGGLNTMSVSLLRLNDGRIALFYARKNSHEDCRPMMRISEDEGMSWSDPVNCIPEKIGYYVLNNDRVIQLENGRILLPVSLHQSPTKEWSNTGLIQCYYSDDYGVQWQAGFFLENPDSAMLQEPGLIKLKNGRLMMFMRTQEGTQYVSFSDDGGINWTPARSSNIVSPLSPASIERIPSTGDLLLVWNNNDGTKKEIEGKRTPYNLAISKDEGRSWEMIKVLEDNPEGWYCYTAIDFVDDQVLLGHCAGLRKDGRNGLEETDITLIDLEWIYNANNGVEYE
ncbi:MAG: exo-alpha-sialidase [Saprospiraceae bacterium]|nr:exo-alpha-sialidase [Saprospiraceae bacterium]